MPEEALHEEQWEYVRTLLPTDLEESAKQSRALLRCRNVPDATALIRMALAYALSDLSLKDVAAWASSLAVAEITGPGLFYRLREAETWLERILAQILAEQVPQAVGGWPVRVVDATVINGPGQKAVQWRAHVLIDPSSGSFHAVELTDDSGGEKLSRHPVQKGELILGDRRMARPEVCMPRGRAVLTWWCASIRQICAPATSSESAFFLPKKKSKCRKRGW